MRSQLTRSVVPHIIGTPVHPEGPRARPGSICVAGAPALSSSPVPVGGTWVVIGACRDHRRRRRSRRSRRSHVVVGDHVVRRSRRRRPRATVRRQASGDNTGRRSESPAKVGAPSLRAWVLLATGPPWPWVLVAVGAPRWPSHPRQPGGRAVGAGPSSRPPVPAGRPVASSSSVAAMNGWPSLTVRVSGRGGLETLAGRLARDRRKVEIPLRDPHPLPPARGSPPVMAHHRP